jgi:anthranilate synthase component II
MALRLLVIDNYDSFTWNLVQLLKEAGVKNLVVAKNDELQASNASYFDKILFSPGPGLPSEVPLMAEIIEKYKDTKSILGICLGHQAIAEAFGGKLKNLDNVYHGIKHRMKITDHSEYLFSGIADGFEAGLYHSWVVDQASLPSDLKVTVVSESGLLMGIAHRRYDIRGLQFHPESYMTPVGKQIIENWLRGG